MKNDDSFATFAGRVGSKMIDVATIAPALVFVFQGDWQKAAFAATFAACMKYVLS